MTLAADAFIRRFLMHILPRGFHRIRHYGLFASATRAATIADRLQVSHSATSVGEVRTSISRSLAFSNGRRPHSGLDRQPPDQADFTRLPQPAAA